MRRKPKRSKAGRAEQLKRFRAERNAELLKLADVLERVAACDVGPLSAAAQDCAANLGRKGDCWGYDLNNLTFSIETPSNTRPSNIGKELTLQLSLSIVCRCDDTSHDPFDKHEFNIELFDSPPPESAAYISWHCDRHIGGSALQDSGESHPLYHFQHGGRKTNEHVADEHVGRVLLLASPRLPHPPMDAILAVDFVLANFNATIWRGLRDESEYTRLVTSAQRRFWKPYTDLLGAAFDGEGPHQTDPVLAIWPTLLSARERHSKLLAPGEE